MKTITLLAFLAGAVILLPGCASTKSTARSTPDADAPTYAVLTGSYLPQPVNDDGVADGPNNVSVLTADQMRNTGASTVPRALNRLGYGR